MKRLFLKVSMVLALILTACSSDDDNNSSNNTENEGTNIKVYEDVSFSFDDSARFFNATTGQLFAEENLTTENGAGIDLVGFSSQAFIAFSSPDEEDVPNGTNTKIQHQDTGLTVEDFDAIEDEGALSELTIVNDDDSIQIDGYQDNIITFETADGRKGAIKLKAINATRLLVDIKVME